MSVKNPVAPRGTVPFTKRVIRVRSIFRPKLQEERKNKTKGDEKGEGFLGNVGLWSLISAGKLNHIIQVRFQGYFTLTLRHHVKTFI